MKMCIRDRSTTLWLIFRSDEPLENLIATFSDPANTEQIKTINEDGSTLAVYDLSLIHIWGIDRKNSIKWLTGGEAMARQRWQEWAENEDNLSVLAAWARAGQTDEEIAKAIGISRSTLSEWKKKHEPIRKALSTGKDFANRLVENSLFKMLSLIHI